MKSIFHGRNKRITCTLCDVTFKNSEREREREREREIDVTIATVRCGLPGALRSSPSLGIQLSYSGHSYVAVLFHLGTSTSHVSNVVCFVRALKNINIKFSTFSIVLPKPHGIDQQGLPVFRFSSGFPSLTQKLPSKKTGFGSIGQASPQPWRGKCSRRQRNQ